jgi:hypothetical protein
MPRTTKTQFCIGDYTMASRIGLGDSEGIGASADATGTPAEFVDEVVRHLAEARRAEALERFAAGDVIHLMRYAREAGPRAIRQLAMRLALDESGLRRFARTAEVIRAGERGSLLALTDARGLPLTWSHLELLAGIRGSAVRMRVAQMVLAERLSVEKLRQWARRREMVSQIDVSEAGTLAPEKSPV